MRGGMTAAGTHYALINIGAVAQKKQQPCKPHTSSVTALTSFIPL